MTDFECDVAVIGSGPSGQRAAVQPRGQIVGDITGMLKLIFHLETREQLSDSGGMPQDRGF